MPNAAAGMEGFNTRRFKLLRLALIAECKTTGRGCHFCHEGFDWDLVDAKRWRHPRYFHAHHLIPLAHGGPQTDPAYLVPAHKVCNEKYGTGRQAYAPSTVEMPHSEEWP